MLKYFPIALVLKDKPVTVIGGGKIAGDKILKLLQAQADIQVIAPQITGRLRALLKNRKIKWLCRKARESDLATARLVIAATNDHKANKQVSLWARKKNIPVNVVDNSALSSFISPAIFQKREAVVTVYTNARAPVLSRDLKNFLKENWNAFRAYRDKLRQRPA